ncbi:MAG: HlyD family secretion protein [Nitrospirae bacterium]|nr:HlyD family secretion protein [Nitrospirota bacterium]
MEDDRVLTNGNHRRKTIAAFVFAAVSIAGIIAGFFYVRYKSTHISTDDAFIDGRIHTISSKVPGTIKNIYVNDNQFVRKGDILLEIDSEDYGLRTKEALSGLDAEKAKISEIKYRLQTAKQQFEEFKAALGAAKANLELQEANMRQADTDLKRAEELLKEDIISKEKYEKIKTVYDVTFAQVKAAKEELSQMQARLETQKAVIKQTESSIEPQKALTKQKEASLGAAELNLSYTKVIAPADGYVTKKSVESGNHIQTGQPLMAVVPLDDIWVTANYKETQLAKVRVGQKVEIKVDTYTAEKFNGRIESIMTGTGAVFSLFPPENATGNYVKVVQRIPVKIILDKGTDPERILRIGMSVEPTIIVEK